MAESAPRTLDVRRLGLIGYKEALELQRALHKQRVEGQVCDTLLVCSHKPVITCGTSTEATHLFVSPQALEAQGIECFDVERGGSVTYHGPEQVVCYPILNLRHYRTDVDWYMRSLEEVIIRTLGDYGIQGTRIPGKTGVWIDEHSKIAFLGVRISRWCTWHGLSLNVLECSERFKTMNPCGLGDIRVISLSEVISRPVSVDEAREQLISYFVKVFECVIPGT